MKLLSRMWEQLADVHARQGCRDGPVGAAELRIRFWIPGLKLADSAVKPNEQHLLLRLLHLFSDARFEQATEAAGADRRGRGAKELAAGNGVLFGSAQPFIVRRKSIHRCRHANDLRRTRAK